MGFFENCLNDIVLGSNVDTLKKFPDNCIDLTVTSPPYDGIRNYNHKLDTKGAPRKELIGNYSFPFEELAEELFRVTKMGGVVVWVVNDQTVDGRDGGKTETGNSFRQALYFMNVGFNLHDTMYYQKPGVRFPDQIRYHQCIEYMFVLSKGRPNTTNIIKDRKNVTYNKNKLPHQGNFKNKRCTDDELVWCESFANNPLKEFGARFNVWLIKPEQAASMKDIDDWKWHPAVFPSELARDHIRTWSKEGDVVLDPFSGSGTTAKEAKKLKRQYIGLEINEEYVEKSKLRIEGVGVTEDTIKMKDGVEVPFIEF